MYLVDSEHEYKLLQSHNEGSRLICFQNDPEGSGIPLLLLDYRAPAAVPVTRVQYLARAPVINLPHYRAPSTVVLPQSNATLTHTSPDTINYTERALAFLQRTGEQKNNLAKSLVQVKSQFQVHANEDQGTVGRNIDSVWDLVNKQLDSFKQFIFKNCAPLNDIGSFYHESKSHNTSGKGAEEPYIPVSNMSNNEPVPMELDHTENPKSSIQRCEWANCGTVCDSAEMLENHVDLEHLRYAIPDEHYEYLCAWAGCEEKLGLRDYLREHIKHSHIQYGVGKCPYEDCDMVFDDPDSLKHHLQFNHRRLMCQIEGCLKEFYAFADMMKHMNEKHPNRPVLYM